MTTGSLDETAFVTLNGSGAGTVSLGPLTAREVWNPVNASVRVNQNPTNEANCVIYVGQTPTQENFRDQTFTGSSGDVTDRVSGKKVSKGDYIWAVWTGGDAGQRACLNVTGEKEI
jgi:hypothetical protein